MKRKLIYGAFMLVLLASCSKEEIVATSQNLANKKPLGVSVGIVQGSTNTKAIVADASFGQNCVVGVYIAGDGYATPTLNSVANTCTYMSLNSAWTISPSLYLSGSTANVYGFYPYSGTSGDVDYENHRLKVTLPVTAKFDGTGLTDYMYATSRAGTGPSYTYPTATASNATNKDKVDLYFNHALASLTFKIIKGTTYPTAGKVTEIKLSNTVTTPVATPFLSGTGYMSLLDGTLSGAFTTAGTTITLTPTDGEYIQLVAREGKLKTVGNKEYLAQTLVAPMTLPTAKTDLSDLNSIKLLLTVDGTTFTTYLPNTVVSWIKGMNYTYTVTVEGKQLTINPTVTVVGFTDYTATTIPGIEVK